MKMQYVSHSFKVIFSFDNISVSFVRHRQSKNILRYSTQEFWQEDAWRVSSRIRLTQKICFQLIRWWSGEDLSPCGFGPDFLEPIETPNCTPKKRESTAASNAQLLPRRAQADHITTRLLTHCCRAAAPRGTNCITTPACTKTDDRWYDEYGWFEMIWSYRCLTF